LTHYTQCHTKKSQLFLSLSHPLTFPYPNLIPFKSFHSLPTGHLMPSHLSHDFPFSANIPLLHSFISDTHIFHLPHFFPTCLALSLQRGGTPTTPSCCHEGSLSLPRFAHLKTLSPTVYPLAVTSAPLWSSPST
jgi:hypothetical protein